MLIRSSRYGCLLLLLVPIVAFAQEAKQAPLDLYDLGKLVYNTGTESCRTCHGVDGKGTSRSTVDLGEPETWKSVKYESALKGSPLEVNQKSLVQTLILMGAKGWNEQNFANLRDHLNRPAELSAAISEPEPFDEDMVGLLASNKKVLMKRAALLMRKAGMPRIKADEIEDMLAASAVVYIEQEFIK